MRRCAVLCWQRSSMPDALRRGCIHGATPTCSICLPCPAFLAIQQPLPPPPPHPSLLLHCHPRRCLGSSSSRCWLSSCSIGCESRGGPTSSGAAGRASLARRFGFPQGLIDLGTLAACCTGPACTAGPHLASHTHRCPLFLRFVSQLCQALRGVRCCGAALARLPRVAHRAAHAAGRGHRGQPSG